jgi:hypothetical protein
VVADGYGGGGGGWCVRSRTLKLAKLAIAEDCQEGRGPLTAPHVLLAQ